MLLNIARFEIRYLFRNPLLWLTAVFTFAMIFASMNAPGFELGSEGGMLRNAAYATLRNYLMLSSVIFMFVTTAFVGNAVIRDDETNFGPIIRSTPITKFEYLFGRYLGAFSVAALLMLLVPLAAVVGSLMPWADPASLGPNRLSDYLYGYFLIALPNLFIHSAIFFALATMTRSIMAMYLGVISLVCAFFALNDAYADRPQLQTVIGVAEPFAARALKDSVRYWTVPERNTQLPDFSGALLYNRLLWVGVAIAFLIVAYAVYRYADQGMSKRERKKQRLAQGGDPSTALGMTQKLPDPRHDRAALRALLWMRTKFEARQVLKTPAFPVLMAWGLYITIFVLLTQRYPDFRPQLPTTLSLIPEIEDAFRMIPLVVAIYYAGELVWRERDRRVHELVDASPLPNWAYVIPKTAAMSFVLVAILLVNVLASVILQLSLGFTDLELSKYLLWYVLPATWDMLLVAAVAIFVHSLSPHKTVGWGIMAIFLFVRELKKIPHNLLNYGGTPPVPLSDLNAAGSFWKGAWTFRLYWGAFAILLLLVAHLLWRRGTEIRLKPRLAMARRRLTGAAGWVGGAALMAFVATGCYAYYNTNVLNEFRTKSAADDDAAEFEKLYGKYRNMPQPTIDQITLDVALYPYERRAVTKGRYRLRNRTAQSIPEIHLSLLDNDLEIMNAAIDGGARLVLNDEKHHYRIYRLNAPIRPGEERVLTCETRLWARGFRNGTPNTRIVENGTFLSENQLMPMIGMSGYLLQDPAVRRKYGLPEAPRPPKLEDAAAAASPEGVLGWAKVDITVSTAADQTPLAPGNKVSDVTRGGRRIARFASGTPIHPRFEIQSARYAEKHRKHAGIDLAVYYHPAHKWNIDRMLDAMAVSLDYYQANFGPYQFDHVRIVEFPGYHSFAQAFAGTIPYSEEVGFISDYSQPETLDYVMGMTAHELAHQWWAHQVLSANVEGEMVLSETLAQYSAGLIMQKLHGQDQIRRYLQYELDRYLDGRVYSSRDEEPLARVTGQNYIGYRKGAMVMYLLQKRLGEQAVNRALRSLVARYKFKDAPYPRTVELMAALRAEAKTAEDQALITDLFERITLYDLKAGQPTAVRRADGKWDVTLPVEAKKFYADGKRTETETPLAERIEIGLFTAEPGRLAFDSRNVILMERHPIRSGHQVLKFVTDQKPAYAGVDPYNYYIDRDSADNVSPVG
ncbi:MAG TPA: M1 family aminopeptidase [Thermoanaerobaculia bacterium]|nr:M1 family aminopeptidase [Thermoanaerobaculia bacterium]